MRRLATVCLAAALAAAPTLAQAEGAGPPPDLVPPAPTSGASAEPFDWYPLALGAGLVIGVLRFNTSFLGWGAVPGAGVYAAEAVVPAEMSVAMSRVYAVSAATAGGLLAHYLYAP